MAWAQNQKSYQLTCISTHLDLTIERERRNILEPSKSERKDSFLDHVEDECWLYCHQSLQYKPQPWTNRAETSVYNCGPLGLLLPRFEGTMKNRHLNQCGTEALTVSIKHRLLVCCVIRMPLEGVGSSPPRWKRL